MKTIAEFLEREGGHVFLLALFALIFAVMARSCDGASPFFEKVALVGFGASMGALTMAMKGNGNKSQDSEVQNKAP